MPTSERTVGTQAAPGWSIWVSQRDKIVSFHPVDRYQRLCFSRRDFFLRKILEMTEQGYRFQ